MKILLVDDNRLMLEGLQNLLEAHNIEVVGTAVDGLQALSSARKLQPDMILMDIRMPLCDGLKATRLIKAEMPHTRIIILTTSNEDGDLFESVKSGACGYMIKSMDSKELIEGLEQAVIGVPPFSPGLALKILDEFARLSNLGTSNLEKRTQKSSETQAAGALNERQIEVLKLVAEGLSYKEVGTRLALSPRTIKYHMAEIMDRLHLENRSQVISYAGQFDWKTEKIERSRQ